MLGDYNFVNYTCNFIKNIKSNDTIEGTEVSKKTEITDEGLESTTSEIGKECK